MKWKHINIIQRDFIASCLSHKKLIDIANELDLDSTSISKEIQRNRIKTRMGAAKNDAYKRTLRFPYCCYGCPKKYFECHFINKSIFFL